jgi:hypothetical protein
VLAARVFGDHTTSRVEGLLESRKLAHVRLPRLCFCVDIPLLGVAPTAALHPTSVDLLVASTVCGVFVSAGLNVTASVTLQETEPGCDTGPPRVLARDGATAIVVVAATMMPTNTRPSLERPLDPPKRKRRTFVSLPPK